MVKTKLKHKKADYIINNLPTFYPHDDYVESLAYSLKDAADEIDRLQELLYWSPIETAPFDTTILTTNGRYMAVAKCPSDEESGSICGWVIDHYAICQKYEWQPTHWMPLPEE